MELYDQLKQFGSVKINEPMAKRTTFRIGGPADVFLTIDSTEKLVEALRFLDGEGVSYFIIGSGSNMLVRDNGFRGVAVNVKCQSSNTKGTYIQADAGCITAQIAQESFSSGLTGFEWGVGVPGTIGGAVRGNAGAMGGEMKDVVKEIEAYRDGEVVTLSNTECAFGYRDSTLKHGGGVVLRATLTLRKGENIEGRKRALEHLAYRAKTQPQGQSIGCVFKNFEISKSQNLKISDLPEEFLKKGKISAGWLIDQSGLKGAVVGGAEVSTKHCNFILNNGHATAADVLALIDEIKTKVYDRFGVALEEEIQII